MTATGVLAKVGTEQFAQISHNFAASSCMSLNTVQVTIFTLVAVVDG
eukprot:CAMPEP_0185904478 /NCGR_PEP_ID=MMETSP0196C-20130402/3774_1 /TAXON_ID=2932 /ORGANISM="Alexandrium fundyense, Strain CCMP1719" /LENGTH=46 /DNA_ID= /DNA_START= /DNA_END= /DNA_ORIENTATION=